MDRNTDRKETQMFTVYGPRGSREFATVAAASTYAHTEWRSHGGTYECRDADFNHVFTVED